MWQTILEAKFDWFIVWFRPRAWALLVYAFMLGTSTTALRGNAGRCCLRGEDPNTSFQMWKKFLPWQCPLHVGRSHWSGKSAICNMRSVDAWWFQSIQYPWSHRYRKELAGQASIPTVPWYRLTARKRGAGKWKTIILPLNIRSHFCPLYFRCPRVDLHVCVAFRSVVWDKWSRRISNSDFTGRAMNPFSWAMSCLAADLLTYGLNKKPGSDNVWKHVCWEHGHAGKW